jgi:hypothetical protein
MREEFKQWLRQRRSINTSNAYVSAISRISQHYSENTGEVVDIYSLSDQVTVSRIANDYSQTGRFSEFGFRSNSTNRAAIQRFSEFLAAGPGAEDPVTSDDNNYYSDREHEISESKFAYEKDLQTVMCSQIVNLFPGYEIFGGNDQGIEYSVGGRRIDILLEHSESGDLLAVELKAGRADYKVFGQIAMYLALLEGQFPERRVSGRIVASQIDESLRQASQITDRVTLHVYRMNLELESA